jgi:hypothetical protein
MDDSAAALKVLGGHEKFVESPGQACDGNNYSLRVILTSPAASQERRAAASV